MKNRIYVYLARRDKKGIKIISSFPHSSKCYPTKINIKDLQKTQLSAKIQQQISIEFVKNNLIYEIYIESATSTNELRSSLVSRGYENIPLQQFSFSIDDAQVNENLLITKKNTMLRKSSDQARRT